MSVPGQPKKYEKGKLFIGGISYDTTEADLKAHFSQYGVVTEAEIKIDQSTQRSRGFGFVKYETDEEVEAALCCKEHVLHGKKIDPKKAETKGTSTKGDYKLKVFVGGVPPIEGDYVPTNLEYTKLKEEIKLIMKDLSTPELPINVVDVDLKRDREKLRHKGFAFVTFETEEQARRATKDTFLHLRGKQVEVKMAQPRPIQQTGQTYYAQQWSHHQPRYSNSGGYYNQDSSYGYNQSAPYDHYSTPHSDSTGYGGHGHNNYSYQNHHHPQSYSYPQTAAQQSHAGYASTQQPQGYGSTQQAQGYGSTQQPQGYGSTQQAQGYGGTQQPQGYGGTQQGQGYGSTQQPQGYGGTQQPQGYGGTQQAQAAYGGGQQAQTASYYAHPMQHNPHHHSS